MTLVLLPAVGLDARCWDWLNGPDHTAVRITYPGFGGTPAVRDTYTIADLADRVAASVPGELHVVGVSMGGMVGQQLALRHPHRVHSLLLANTTGVVAPEPVRERVLLAEMGRMAELVELTLELWFSPSFLATQPEPAAVQYARRTLLSLEPRSFALGWRAIAGHSALEALTAIRAPVTCLAGDADVSTPPEVLEAIHARIPGSRLVLCQGPHMLQLEQPATFQRALDEHLDWARTTTSTTRPQR